MSISERQLGHALLGFLGLGMFALLFLSTGSNGGADSYVHYRIARFAWSHPELFLDHWGKPVFTLFMSVPALLGMKGAMGLNILTCLITAWAIWQSAKVIIKQNAFMAIPFVILIPISFMSAYSVMTEQLYAMLLALGLYFTLKERWLWAVLILSLVPLIRNEGMLLLAYMGIYLLFKKQWKYVPLLATTLVIYSVVGWLGGHHILWLWKEIPYNVVTEEYGHGTWYHYLIGAPAYLGRALILLCLLGVFDLAYRLMRKQKEDGLMQEILLFLVPFGLFFVLNSYLWWQGLAGTLGFHRVLGTVLPLTAIPALRGFNMLVNMVNFKWLRYAIFIGVSGVLLFKPFKQYHFPVAYSALEEPVVAMCQHVEHLGLQSRKLHYYHPIGCHILGKDPFDETQATEQIADKERPELTVESGAIVIWDNRFGPSAGSMPLSKLLDNPAFTPLARIHTVEYTDNLWGADNDVWLFEKKPRSFTVAEQLETIHTYPSNALVHLSEDSTDSQIYTWEHDPANSPHQIELSGAANVIEDVQGTVQFIVEMLDEKGKTRYLRGMPLDKEVSFNGTYRFSTPRTPCTIRVRMRLVGSGEVEMKRLTINSVSYQEIPVISGP